MGFRGPGAGAKIRHAPTTAAARRNKARRNLRMGVYRLVR
jgi:hypothetical protein